MASRTFDFLNFDAKSAIPFPKMDYLSKLDLQQKYEEKAPMKKHEKAYEDFCRWSALPVEWRKPKTQTEFERRYKLPRSYASIYFKHKDDYYPKCKRYMWEWIRELFPTFIHSQYTLAVKEGHPSAIKFFGDLVAREMEVDKPKTVVQPFMIVGVSQEKINRLFIPDSMKEIEGEIVNDNG